MANIALSSAVSSLLVLEKSMGVVSNNISNANTVGYTTETEQIGSNVAGGIGGGVNDLGTINNVDQFKQAAVFSANATSTQATTFSDYYQSLQQALGQISNSATGGNDIASQLATLQTTLSQLAATPQSTALQNTAVSNLDDLTANLRNLSTTIQNLRSQADQQVSAKVADANTQLNTINTLNMQIETAQANNESTAALSDQRNNALQTLSADMGVTSYTAANGALQIFTKGGQALLVDNTVNVISHSNVTISGKMSYPNGGIGGIIVGNTDITSQITSGSIAALVQQRDVELPNAQNSLNYIAQNLANGLNAISNLGSASPPPSQLTSCLAAGYNSSDPVTPSATSSTVVRVAMVNSSGQVQNYQDVNLSSVGSVGDVVNAINTAFGSTVAQINSSGQLVLQGTPPNGIAVDTLSGSLNNTDFSSFFHLNDVLTSGTSTSSLSAATISVNPAMLANSSLFPIGTLNNTQQTNPANASQTAGNPPFIGIGAGDGSTASALSSALLANVSFTTGTATSTAICNSANAVPSGGISGSFVINGGDVPVAVSVTSNETLAQIAAAINSAASSAGSKTVSAQVVGNGVYQLQITSGGSQLSFSNLSGDALEELGISNLQPTGNLGATTTTYGGLATDLISNVATLASDASNQQTSSQATLKVLQSDLSNQSGVNVDQQTAQLTVLQNDYAASARVITTVQAMFTALLNAVGA